MSERKPWSSAQALERWARQRCGSLPLARALGLAYEAELEGHACVRLPELDLVEQAELAAHPWVGDGSVVTPCVRTREGDFFLWRNWRHELQVAHALLDRVAAAAPVPAPELEADLAWLFDGSEAAAVAGQRAAVAALPGRRLCVLTGGPGTGKTTTVLRMLLMLQRQRADRPPLSIALAAPTGKAAQRLSQALREGIAALRPRAQSAPAWQAALAQLPERAQTLHRLLGFDPASDRFRHGPARPLAADVVVVDEASMVDLALMRALLDALAPQAILLLVGDPDQLVSVSAGSVLADWVSVARSGVPGIAAHSVELTHVWRAGSALAASFDAIRRGDAHRLQTDIEAGQGLARRPVHDAATLQRALSDWLNHDHGPALQALCAAPVVDPAQAFAHLRRRQLLTALRNGPYGADAVNARIDAHWRQQHGQREWYPGRPLLIRQNDYARRLYNGDVGLVMRQDGELRVAFETVDGEGGASFRWLSPRELPAHDLGYALTVHQSQGSEYAEIAVLLPPDRDHPILTRQLLYTAVSRARAHASLWCDAASLQAALGRVSVRAGGLRRRLCGD
ncbi:MAG: exodeoxyribonuclease V subunit alpha [Lysobacterales bacterium]